MSLTIDVSTARMVANHRKWGLSVPYSGRRTVSHNLANYLGFNKPSDHGQLRDGETQTRASHRISHDPKDYLALRVSNCGVFTSVEQLPSLVCGHYKEIKTENNGVYRGTNTPGRNTGTKKINCPCELVGNYYKTYDFWTLTVKNGEHNHDPAMYMEGHAFAKRLTKDERRMVDDMTDNNVPLRFEIQSFISILNFEFLLLSYKKASSCNFLNSLSSTFFFSNITPFLILEIETRRARTTTCSQGLLSIESRGSPPSTRLLFWTTNLPPPYIRRKDGRSPPPCCHITGTEYTGRRCPYSLSFFV
ncbi:hypothetical protein LXL04_015998 [Taraxacum kok-saghyz]